MNYNALTRACRTYYLSCTLPHRRVRATTSTTPPWTPATFAYGHASCQPALTRTNCAACLASAEPDERDPRAQRRRQGSARGLRREVQAVHVPGLDGWMLWSVFYLEICPCNNIFSLKNTAYHVFLLYIIISCFFYLRNTCRVYSIIFIQKSFFY
jgi:hypothetical protein